MSDVDRVLYARLRSIVAEASKKLPDVHVRDQIEAALEDPHVRLEVVGFFVARDGVEWGKVDVAGIAYFAFRLDDWDPDDLLGRNSG